MQLIDFGDPGTDLTLGDVSLLLSTIHRNYSTTFSKVLRL